MSAVTYKQQYTAQAFRLIEHISNERLDNVYCFGPGFDQHVGESLRSLLSADIVRCLPLPDAEAEAMFRKNSEAHGMHIFDTATAAAMQGLG